MLKNIIASVVLLGAINSFALTSDEEFQDRQSGCKAVGAEIFFVADGLFEKDFNEKWLEIDNPSEEQRETYGKYYEIASQQLAADIAQFCE